MKSSLSFLAAVCALTALPAVASAQDQPWLKDRRFTEGPGYRVGDFELHPGASAEFGYDSNFFRRADSQSPIGSLRLRITPSFSVSTIGQQRREGAANTPPPSVEFRGGIAATYNEFFPLHGVGKSVMSDQRNVGGLVDLGLNILPGRPWSGQLHANLARLITASEQGNTDASFNRTVPSASAELIWTPGAGLFEWRLGYQFTGTIFESARFSNLTNLNNTILTRGRWRFLPRTALVFDGRFGFINYTNTTGAVGEKTASHPLRAMIGVNGLITNSIGLTVMGGWGASFYTPKPQQDFDSFIGQVELKWFISQTPTGDASKISATASTLSVGFQRDFFDSLIGTYFERNRGYANLSYFYGGKFLLVIDAGAGPIRYPDMVLIGGNVPAFTNVRIDSQAFLEYRFKDYLGLNLTLRYNQNISSVLIPSPGGQQPDDLSYKQFEAYLGFRWMM